ncbi:MAG: hypothetical protein LBN27_01740 [Prevotellaceae bacterium]|nr:hypothetical protein [Prevotellaceae bacterium]
MQVGLQFRFKAGVNFQLVKFNICLFKRLRKSSGSIINRRTFPADIGTHGIEVIYLRSLRGRHVSEHYP